MIDVKFLTIIHWQQKFETDPQPSELIDLLILLITTNSSSNQSI